ncbi:MAG TPA: isomerizing glutamine--fructose-6-phosphate transaminase [Candidatus Bathyarchaeia archaeon]|nr:isomerizing glutamine--fructose-6-phosphate transaminase [Candidatus Bathyarchaeia archaeon]
MPQPETSARTFPSHMLKEIYEQPEAIRQTISQHIDPVTRAVRPDRFPWTPSEIDALRRITIVASGASRHAGLCGKLMIEELAGIPVEVEHASEYGYRRPTNGKGSLVIAITQSGETADTTAAQRIARDNGMKTLSISNVIDSTISREADANFFTRAGREIAIPATKSFTTQLTALYMLALYLAAQREMFTPPEVAARVRALSALPELIQRSLDPFNAEAEAISADFFQDQTFVFLGRGVHYPIALEGALKLKEISYVHAEGYPTGEFRHGPTALITETLPVVAIVTYDRRDPESVLRYEKSIALLEDIRQISKRQILLAEEGDQTVRAMGVPTFTFPHIEELLLPIMEVVPLQFLAYHIAVRNGLDVDRPRNLVKSVTAD